MILVSEIRGLVLVCPLLIPSARILRSVVFQKVDVVRCGSDRSFCRRVGF